MTTCKECQHFKRCQWLLGRTGREPECDWRPSRFVAEGSISIGAPDAEDDVLAFVSVES